MVPLLPSITSLISVNMEKGDRERERKKTFQWLLVYCPSVMDETIFDPFLHRQICRYIWSTCQFV